MVENENKSNKKQDGIINLNTILIILQMFLRLLVSSSKCLLTKEQCWHLGNRTTHYWFI